MNTAPLKADESLVIVKRQFSSVPMEYRFSAQATAEGNDPAGRIEICRRRVLSKLPTETLPLLAENTVAAGFWDTFVTVTVHADQDLVISSKQRFPGKSLLLILLIALGVIVVAALIFWISFS